MKQKGKRVEGEEELASVAELASNRLKVNKFVGQMKQEHKIGNLKKC